MRVNLRAKKFLAVVLAVIMIFSALPSSVVGAIGTTQDTLYLTLPEYNSVTASVAESSVEIKALAQTLNTGFKNYEKTVDVSAYNLHYSTEYLDDINFISNVMSGYLPESFHIASGFGVSYNDATDQIIGITPTYLYSQQEYNSMLAACNAKANEILAGIKGNNSLGDVEKALLIHDRIALHCEYDYERYLKGMVPRISHTMYGVLGNGVAVCQGYALTYGWLLDMVGIKNEYVSSDALNHAWNIVYINDKPYHVDVTADDPSWDITGRVLHKYFLCSTNRLRYDETEENGRDRNHYAFDYNSTPTDTTYDDYLWRDSRTAFTLLDNEIYYICNIHDHIMRYSDNSPIYDITDHWWANEQHTAIWADQARLDTDGNVLLFSLPDGIYSFNPKNSKVRLVWKATLTSYFSVFGFTYDGGYLIYDISLTPNFDENTKKLYEFKVKYTPPKQTPAGDINGDSDVSLDDVVLMAQNIAGWSVETGGASLDVNSDGTVTLDDVVLLAQFIAGWSVTLS